ncbi:MAG TPA: helix-turn-helix domain-containing protein [Pseudonocardia sp.]|uniref:helix-turn-helix domain-containing protein n=1 Tax=Pseudonocardia sp. TaxID=60912 RepID=UPI002B9EF7F7|nr:helix-turn-helix domain-containing protein [Pseudonocardia sp.]HTF54748.1 helix-turn-helix domain-containing protein [Pseudonocardia sp.]
MPGDWMEILTAPERQGLSVTEVCRRYGIARKTFYTHLARYRAEGDPGLAPRRRRNASGSRVPGELVQDVLRLRVGNPGWGARRIRAELLKRHDAGCRSPAGGLPVPAASTIHEILVRAGLIMSRDRQSSRKVDTQGTISFRGRRIQLGTAARGRTVVVEEAGSQIRILADAELLRELPLGPVGAYHGSGKKPTGRPRALPASVRPTEGSP